MIDLISSPFVLLYTVLARRPYSVLVLCPFPIGGRLVDLAEFIHRNLKRGDDCLLIVN